MTSKPEFGPSPKKQSRSREKPRGFADEARGSFEQAQTDDGITLAIAAAIRRSRSVLELHAEAVATARAKTEAARRKSYQLRVANIRRWSMARAKLLAAVLEIDRAIQCEGMSLGMIDFDPHPCDVAAVQVQLAVLGRLSCSLLEIVVFQDMSQRARIVNAQSPVALPKLPTATCTEQRQYFSIVLAYVEGALPRQIGGEDIVCQKCGLFIPALGGDPLTSSRPLGS